MKEIVTGLVSKFLGTAKQPHPGATAIKHAIGKKSSTLLANTSGLAGGILSLFYRNIPDYSQFALVTSIPLYSIFKNYQNAHQPDEKLANLETFFEKAPEARLSWETEDKRTVTFTSTDLQNIKTSLDNIPYRNGIAQMVSTILANSYVGISLSNESSETDQKDKSSTQLPLALTLFVIAACTHLISSHIYAAPKLSKLKDTIDMAHVTMEKLVLSQEKDTECARQIDQKVDAKHGSQLKELEQQIVLLKKQGQNDLLANSEYHRKQQEDIALKHRVTISEKDQQIADRDREIESLRNLLQKQQTDRAIADMAADAQPYQQQATAIQKQAEAI